MARPDSPNAPSPAILVAGTGRVPLPPLQQWVVSKLGAAICRAGYSLITGGWDGVDAGVAQAFVESGGEPSRIVQFVKASDPPPRTYGRVIDVADDLEEWVEAINRAQAVVLVGGLGGTYGTYEHARKRHVPVVPIPGTGGDAERAFRDILKRWTDDRLFRRISRDEFAHVDVPVDLRGDAERAVVLALALLKSELTPRDDASHTTAASTVVNIHHATIGGLAVGASPTTHGVVSSIAATPAQGADAPSIPQAARRKPAGVTPSREANGLHLPQLADYATEVLNRIAEYQFRSGNFTPLVEILLSADPDHEDALRGCVVALRDLGCIEIAGHPGTEVLPLRPAGLLLSKFSEAADKMVRRLLNYFRQRADSERARFEQYTWPEVRSAEIVAKDDEFYLLLACLQMFDLATNGNHSIPGQAPSFTFGRPRAIVELRRIKTLQDLYGYWEGARRELTAKTPRMDAGKEIASKTPFRLPSRRRAPGALPLGTLPAHKAATLGMRPRKVASDSPTRGKPEAPEGHSSDPTGAAKLKTLGDSASSLAVRAMTVSTGAEFADWVATLQGLLSSYFAQRRVERWLADILEPKTLGLLTLHSDPLDGLKHLASQSRPIVRDRLNAIGDILRAAGDDIRRAATNGTAATPTPSGGPEADAAKGGAGMETPTEWSSKVTDYRGKVDVIIVTIKAEEFKAVQNRLVLDVTVRGKRDWNMCRVLSKKADREVRVATVRQIDQGTNEAYAVVSDAIEDLDPSYILVVGIAGAVPGDLTLGDVVFGKHIHDLTVQEVKPNGSRVFSIKGGGTKKSAQVMLANLDVSLPPELHDLRLPPLPTIKPNAKITGDAKTAKKIRAKLEERYGSPPTAPVHPYFTDGEVASSDTLVKYPELVEQWKTFGKHIAAVDMESAGAYRASQTRDKQYPMIPIRGISDVIGLERDDSWTLYACEVAAEFALAFIRTWRIPPRSGPSTEPSDRPSTGLFRPLAPRFEVDLSVKRLPAPPPNLVTPSNEAHDLRRRPTVRFLDAITVDSASLENALRDVGNATDLLIEWHSSIRAVRDLISDMSRDAPLDLFPWHNDLANRAAHVTSYWQGFRAAERELAETESRLPLERARLLTYVRAAPITAQVDAFKTLLLLHAMTLVMRLRQFNGRLVSKDRRWMLIYLFTDLPVVDSRLALKPIRNRLANMALGYDRFGSDQSFLRARIESSKPGYEKVALPATTAERLQDERPGICEEDFFRWVLPQWVRESDVAPPPRETLRVTVLQDEDGKEKYSRNAVAPWSRKPEREAPSAIPKSHSRALHDVKLPGDLHVAARPCGDDEAKPKAARKSKKKLTLRESLTKGERPRFKKSEDPAAPVPKEVSAKTLEARVGTVEVLLLTATPTERTAALCIMQSSPSVITGTLEGKRYIVGRVGRHLVALTKSRAGSGTRDGSLLTVSRAIKTWKPRAVIAVGIAFGGYTAKQKIADVLVSTRLFHYEARREQKPFGIERGPVPDAGKVLLEQFGDVDAWSFVRPDGEECEVHEGPLLTGEKLVDDLDFKEQLFERFPEAIGGEMEGSGIYAACSDAHHTEWIVVKAVCDWADGTKGKAHQKVAASAAASLVEHVLQRNDPLAAIPWSNKKAPKETKEKKPNPPVRAERPELVEHVREPEWGQKAKAVPRDADDEHGRAGTFRADSSVHMPSAPEIPPPVAPTAAEIKKKLAGLVDQCRKVKATITRYKWPLVRALVELSVFRDDSLYHRTRRVPLGDLVVELGRTPEFISEYLTDLGDIGYLDIDEDGVRLTGHADCFTKLARALVNELPSDREEQAGELFDELLK